MVATASFAGIINTIAGNSVTWTFAGPTATVTVASGQRLTAVASALLRKFTAGSQFFDYGICYSSGGTLTNFAGLSNYLTAEVDNGPRHSYAASATVAPPAGTYSVGFCVRNGGTNPIDDNDYVNGWVQVTN
ncbi:MAG: hypothetical protein ACOZIN_08185 [Myxococcota bacterium]